MCRPSRGGACRGQASRGTCTTRRSSGQHTSWFLIDWKDREEIKREREIERERKREREREMVDEEEKHKVKKRRRKKSS